MSVKDNDFILVSQVQIFNSQKAFEKLVLKHQSSVRRLLINLTLGNHSLADDLAQETFIKVFLKINTFQATAQFSTWIYRIACNVFLDYKKNKRVEYIHHLPDNSESYASYPKLGDRDEMDRLLAHLKDVEREVIILSYIEEMSQREIAKILDLPLGTVKTHIKRGREKVLAFLMHHKEFMTTLQSGDSC